MGERVMHLLGRYGPICGARYLCLTATTIDPSLASCTACLSKLARVEQNDGLSRG